MAIINIERLSVWYKTSRSKKSKFFAGLDDVSLSVEHGETLGVVGESGSGKSTLGRTIAGLERPTKGTLNVADFDLHTIQGNISRKFWDEVQMVWQDPLGSLTPTMKMGDILSEAFRRGRKKPRSEVNDRVAELLEMVQMPLSSADQYAHEISGGQRQRIAIARAFAAKPSVVVLDEAVSALDVLTQNQILQLLLDLQKRFGVTYIFISHDLGVVSKMADHTAVLYAGHLMEFGKTSDIANNPQNPYTKELLESTLSINPREHVTSEIPARRVAPFRALEAASEGCPYVKRCVDAVDACTAEPAPRVILNADHVTKCHRASTDLSNSREVNNFRTSSCK